MCMYGVCECYFSDLFCFFFTVVVVWRSGGCKFICLINSLIRFYKVFYVIYVNIVDSICLCILYTVYCVVCICKCTEYIKQFLICFSLYSLHFHPLRFLQIFSTKTYHLTRVHPNHIYLLWST